MHPLTAKRWLAGLFIAGSMVAAACSEESQAPEPVRNEVDADGYLRYLAAPSEVGLHWQDDDGEPYGQLEQLRQHLERNGEQVRLLANAGIYLPGQIPAGLHIEDGVELRPLNLADGEGNFQLLPNGVFYIADGTAGVIESNEFAAAGLEPSLAVQSGPQLLLDGQMHPAFSEASTSTNIRNGVGVTPDGDVLFLIATKPVTFWDFATEFREHGVANALYLDGAISAMDQPVEGEPLPTNVPFAGILSVTE